MGHPGLHHTTIIFHSSCHKGAGVNADSIDIFIDLAQANIPSTSINLNFIFNQIYQNNLPPPIKRYFTDVYLFCLHEDPRDKSKFRPLGIPTAIHRLIASHVAHTFRKKLPVTCSPSIMPLEPQTEQTSSSTQCNYRPKNISPSPNQPTPSLPAWLSSLTSPTSSTVSPVKRSSKSSQIPSPKSSPSPPFSTNKRGPSTTNGLMAHGAPSSWRRASAKAANCHPFLPCLLLQTSSSHSTSNYVKEPPLAFKTVTQGMLASEGLPILLVTLTTSPHASLS